MSVIPQFAAASDDLYDFLNNSKKATKSITQGIGKFLKTSKPNYNQEFLVVDPASSSSPVNSDGINSTPVSPVSPTSGKVNTSNKDAQPKKKKAVFCSQLAALFYEELECDGFTKGCAGKFTPVELVKSASFESEDHYIKKGDKFLVGPDGQTIID